MLDRLIFDAGPLITACKFEVEGRPVVDHLLERCEIAVTGSVHREVVIAGAKYPDAEIAQERISQEKIAVLVPIDSPVRKLIAPYGLGDGEQEGILLAGSGDLQPVTLVMDDHLAYLVCDRLGIKKRFLLDVVVDLVEAEMLATQLATNIVQAIRTRYPPAFVEHTLLLLRR